MLESSTLTEHPSGFVYVLSNPAMPGLYKIGQTSRSPYLRAVDLSIGTAIAAPYKVLAAVFVKHRFDAETEVHRAFCTRRLSSHREFFEFSDDDEASSAFVGLFLKTDPSFLMNEQGQISETQYAGTLAAQVDGLGMKNSGPDIIEQLHLARENISHLRNKLARLQAELERNRGELEDMRDHVRALHDESRKIRTERDHLIHQKHMEAKVRHIVQWCAENPSEKVYVLRDLLAQGKP